jgi:hypothetical protein
MGKIDMDAVINSYNGTKDISTWSDFVNAISKPNAATGQNMGTTSSSSARWPQSKDFADTKYSFGISVISSFVANTGVNGTCIIVNGVNAAVIGAATNQLIADVKSHVAKTYNGAVSSKVTAAEATLNGIHTAT